MAKQTVSVTITGDSRKLRRAFDQAERDAAGFAGKMKAFGSSVRSSLSTWAPVAGAAMIGFGVHAINVASDVEEAGNKIDVVFGKSAAAVRAFGEDAANTMGMSQREYLTFAGRIGALVKPMGASEEQAAEMSTTLTKLAADIGSFDNVSAEEALTALAAAMSGEMEPMKRFGVVLNDAALKAKALELGLYSGKGTLDAYAKSQAAYALILEGTTDKQDDYIRTADGVAQKTKSAKAKFEDLTGQIGEKLLPVANVALDGLIASLDRITEWWATDGQPWLTDFQAGLDELTAWWDAEVIPRWDAFIVAWGEFTGNWERFWQRFRDGWDNFHKGLVELHRIAMEIWAVWWEIGKGVVWVVTTMWDGIVAFGRFLQSIWNFLSAIGDGVQWVVDQIWKIPGAIKGAADAFSGFGGSLVSGGGGILGAITGRFDSGGVVPGAVGKPRLAIVEGGETILPTHKANFGGGQPVVINIAGHRVAEVLLPAISDQLAKDRRAHTGSRRVG